MRSWGGVKVLFRKATWRERLFFWLGKEHIDSIEAKVDSIWTYAHEQSTFEKRFKEEQIRIQNQHRDWLQECERGQNRHEEFMVLLKQQAELMERMNRILAEKL